MKTLVKNEGNNIQSQQLIFFVNGEKVSEPNPDPEMTLLTYLRTKLRLTGSKLGCGEGGCGACTVMVSRYSPQTEQVYHYSANACLAPVCSLHGLAVTTVEGIGSLGNIHPIQERLAKFHGSQCGFCTPGIVMSMYTLLRNNPQPNMAEMEAYFDGNLCRCTGYRPILDGLQTFTKEFQCSMGDSCCRNTNKNNPSKDQGLGPKIGDLKPYNPGQEPIFPPDLKVNHDLYHGKSLQFSSSNMTYIQLMSLDELVELKSREPGMKLVVGNTEIGIETRFKNMKYKVLVNPSNIPELSAVSSTEEGITLGAAVTLSRLNQELVELTLSQPEYKTRSFLAIIEMLKWFASQQIRNVASVCGNIVTASPISDLNPLFMAAGVSLRVMSKERGTRIVKMDKDFFLGYRKTAVATDEIVVSITIPYTSELEFFHGFKQANRKEDDISVVSAGMKVTLESDLNKVTSATLAFGGMGPMTVLATKTMDGIIGRAWTDDLHPAASELLTFDLHLDPGSPGGRVEYRLALAQSFFFKFYLSVKRQIGAELTPSTMSAINDLDHPARSSLQVFGGTDKRDVTEGSGLVTVGVPLPHRAALQQSTGEAMFLDDIPPAKDELHMYLVTSTKAHARLLNVDVSAALSSPGVVDYVSAADVPGQNKLSIFMDTVFATDKVTSQGQVIGAVVADSHEQARQAARLVTVEYEELEPIITIQEAIDSKSFYGKPLNLSYGDVATGFRESNHVIEGHAHIGGQYHFYMETNACRVTPIEAGEIDVICSSQSLSDVQTLLSTALDIPMHKIYVKTKRLGGGFGGKDSQPILLAAPAAVAALKLGRSVRCILDRDDDMIITGNRSSLSAKYKIGITSDGKIIALDLELYINAGNSLDLSRAVFSRTMLETVSKYHIPHLKQSGRICRTNITSNTAFRGFGSPQGAFIMENIIDDIAAYLKMESKQVQAVNLYQPGQLTFYGEDGGGEFLARCWQMLLYKSQYERRRQDVDRYNLENKWKKKGIAMFPLSFGMGFFEARHMNQAGALVHVYRDGTVLLSHGGVEMGQGLHTKIIQVASEVLHIPHQLIHISETSTTTVPNTTCTAGSTSTDLNGAAVKDACEKLMSRIEPYKKKNPDSSWLEWINAAYMDMNSLSATGFYRNPEIGFDMETGKGHPFHYHTYGAACSEVQIDCLTGDHTVLRTDIVMDIGRSINPAVDVGQIEGAFVQGLGLFMLEEIKVTPEGVHLTRGPGNYKIPSFGNIPSEFNVYLVPDSPRPNTIFSSKGLNEPPLLCAISVFMAAKDAIRSARRENSADDSFELFSPAVPARIRMACKDDISKGATKTSPKNYRPWFVDL